MYMYIYVCIYNICIWKYAMARTTQEGPQEHPRNPRRPPRATQGHPRKAKASTSKTCRGDETVASLLQVVDGSNIFKREQAWKTVHPHPHETT